MSRPHVPKFGEWADGGNSYPYTVCFDKARKDRAGDKSETPYDPQPQVTPNMPPPYGESRFQPPQPRARYHQEHKTRPDNSGDHKQYGSNHSSKSGNKQSRRTRPRSSEGDAFIISHEQNPPAAEYVRVKNSSKDTPSGKGSHDKGHKRDAKANRVRHNSIGDEHERVGVALPKFGQWDVNPASSEGGYTQVFNLKREGKKNIAKSPLLIPVPVDQEVINSRQRRSTGSDVHTSSNVHTASCCFPWSRR